MWVKVVNIPDQKVGVQLVSIVRVKLCREFKLVLGSVVFAYHVVVVVVVVVIVAAVAEPINYPSSSCNM